MNTAVKNLGRRLTALLVAVMVLTTAFGPGIAGQLPASTGAPASVSGDQGHHAAAGQADHAHHGAGFADVADPPPCGDATGHDACAGTPCCASAMMTDGTVPLRGFPARLQGPPIPHAFAISLAPAPFDKPPQVG